MPKGIPSLLPNGYNVRQATLEDIPRLKEIWIEGASVAIGSEADPSAFDHTELTTGLKRMVAVQDECFKFWVATNSSGIIQGWSTIQPFHSSPWLRYRQTYGFISTYISSAARGTGLGKQLVNFVLDFCREMTPIAYVLGTQDRTNTASVLITDRAGFKDYGKLPAVAGVTPISLIACTTKKQITES